jgi:hypothetical protein
MRNSQPTFIILNLRDIDMRKIKREDTAPFILIYGPTNIGKTTSIVRTAPQPIYYISVEGDVCKSIDVVEDHGESVDIDPECPESHEDLMETLNSILIDCKQGTFMPKSLIFDSGSHWMNVELAIRCEDDRNVGREGGDKGKLSAQTKTDWTEVNTANSQMVRLTHLLREISLCGVMVVMTSQEQSNPKWNRELEAAPSFNYKDYNKALKGFFDYIGFALPNFEKDADGEFIEPLKSKYPPLLSFCGNRGYLVKWRGIQPKNLTTKFDLSKRFSWFCK